MPRALRLWTLLALAGGAVLLGALSIGATPMSPAAVLHLLWSPDGSPAAEVLHGLRLPRALAAFATGGLLAVAGALMQVLLRNPLADPYVLGVSGGAAVGALGAMLLGLGAWLVQVGAFAGALASIAAVFAIAHRDLARLATGGTAESAPRLLLTGVMLAAGWSALIALMLALAPQAQLRGMLFWLAGDLSGVESAGLPLAALALLVLLAYPLARELNVLLRGPAIAASLGVQIVPLRRRVYLLASLASAVAVTTAGSIGFVGLLVPHALRLLMGNDQRVLLPACALAGGAFLVVADTAARSLVAPQQLPVGVLTALVGVPGFLLLLMRRPRP
jgi:iron complex transport system permease protein